MDNVLIFVFDVMCYESEITSFNTVANTNFIAETVDVRTHVAAINTWTISSCWSCTAASRSASFTNCRCSSSTSTRKSVRWCWWLSIVRWSVPVFVLFWFCMNQMSDQIRILASPLSSATLGKLLTHIVPLSPNSIIWYQPCLAAGKVTVGLASH